jgi:3-oxoacyl-[acyl-carrier protein] reductase
MNFLVTGGSSGLGKSLVEKLCSDKKNTVFFTYNLSKESAEAICYSNHNAHKIKCDFTQNSETDKFIKIIQSLNLNVFINNYYTGKFLYKHFHKIESDEFLNEFSKNIIPVIKITQEVIREFRKKKSGEIITVLSESIKNPPIGTSMYVGNKFFLKGLSKIWAIENKKFGINSRYICPPFMKTNFTKDIDERFASLLIGKKPYSINNISDKIISSLNNALNDNEIEIKL